MDRDQIMQSLFGYQSEEEEANSKQELNRQASFVSDGSLEPDNEGKVKSKGETKVNRRGDQKGSHLRSSRSPANEKGKTPAEVIRDVFGDSDDEPTEFAAYSRTNEKNVCISPKYKGNIISDEGATDKFDEERTQAKLKGNKVVHPVVIEIPWRPTLGHRDQTATIKLSNIIGIVKEQFDPKTFVEEEFYTTDVTGSICKRCIPPANIIRWREVHNPDGTTSVESNARFVEWKNGSFQLLIGDEPFDVSKQEVKDIESHIFIKHEKGIYQAQGKVSRKMMFMPSSLSSNSHLCLTALIDSRNKKVNKVREYITEVDPERMIAQNEKAERERIKASKQLHNKKKKVTNKYIPKGWKESPFTTSFLDEDDEQDYYTQPNLANSHHFDLDLETEAAVEKRIMSAKKGTKYTKKPASSNVKLHLSKEKVKLEGNEVGEEEMQEEEFYEDSEVEAEKGGPKAKGKQSGRKLKRKYIESDDDVPQTRSGTSRRKKAIIYDSDDE